MKQELIWFSRIVLAVMLGVTVGVLMTGCSSNHYQQVTNHANPCATKGASYLVHLKEESGTCGPQPDQVLNVNADGTTPGLGDFECDSIQQDRCTARDTGCTSSLNGVTCRVTFTTTFQDDGSSAYGVETVSCSNSDGSCTSTYIVTMSRW